jgi:hypothetical protein
MKHLKLIKRLLKPSLLSPNQQMLLMPLKKMLKIRIKNPRNLSNHQQRILKEVPRLTQLPLQLLPTLRSTPLPSNPMKIRSKKNKTKFPKPLNQKLSKLQRIKVLLQPLLLKLHVLHSNQKPVIPNQLPNPLLPLQVRLTPLITVDNQPPLPRSLLLKELPILMPLKMNVTKKLMRNSKQPMALLKLY